MKHEEAHTSDHVSKLNWLRAAVLGANDGIVSIAGLVLGVAGATDSKNAIFTAGMAGIIAGAISMAAGEYVSVSSSRDTERALLEKEKFELEKFPEQELQELVAIYMQKGLARVTAQKVAEELTAHDPLKAHFDAELKIDPDDLTNPWHAALASAAAFVLGSAIPFTAILVPSDTLRVPIAFVAVLTALIITGALSARVGGANIPKAIIRVVTGGFLAMTVTYWIGKMFGATVL